MDSGCGVQGRPIGKIMIDHSQKSICLVNNQGDKIDHTEYSEFEDLAINRAHDLARSNGGIMLIVPTC